MESNEITENEITEVEQQIKTKPFDLEKALKGHTVVMRDGTRVAEVIKPKTTSNKILSVAANNAGVVSVHHLNGECHGGFVNRDLFMLDSVASGWINVYPGISMDNNKHCGTTIYKTRKEARRAAIEINRSDLIQAKVKWRE